MIYDLKHKVNLDFLCSFFLFYALQRFDIFHVISSMVGYPYQDNMSVKCLPLEPYFYTAKLGYAGVYLFKAHLSPSAQKASL